MGKRLPASLSLWLACTLVRGSRVLKRVYESKVLLAGSIRFCEKR
jgi:hypothetical protein